MHEGQRKMQNAQGHGSNKERHSTNHFNDSEYARWSQRFTATQSPKTQWGIESFLGTTENPQPDREDISASLQEIGEK